MILTWERWNYQDFDVGYMYMLIEVYLNELVTFNWKKKLVCVREK